MGDLQLNETEFNWITKPHPREVMVKRKTGESVILNIDLAPLKNHLKIFDSSSDSRQHMDNLRRNNKEDWKSLFLNGDTPVL
ncbi:MAG: hypothetical protein GY718_02530 [Lentisphaerae bacterium]|nr:hypothetical protein [Lentisphaerota bacterium]